MRVILGWLYCFVFGHEFIMQYELRRVYLRCTNCGRETPGISSVK